jgi:hypothetical protein
VRGGAQRTCWATPQLDTVRIPVVSGVLAADFREVLQEFYREPRLR